MSFLICEPSETHCEAIEMAKSLQDATDIIHAKISQYDEPEQEPLTLSNSFLALRPVNKLDLPETLPRGWTNAYSAYVVRHGEPNVTLDTEMFVLEF